MTSPRGSESGGAPRRGGVAAVVLAAGGSSRMGSPKQLLPVEGESVLRRAARTALGSRCTLVRVVLGAQAGRLAEELSGLPVEVVTNPAWRTGIASSLRAGLRGLPRDVEAVLVLLADQVRVTPDLLDRMVGAFLEDRPALVACGYAGTLGAPALFHRSLFRELRLLSGDVGAKPVLLRHADEAAVVPFEDASADLDTPEDCGTRLPRPPHPRSGPAPE